MIILGFVVLYFISELLSVSITKCSSHILDSCHSKLYSCENPSINTYCSCDSFCKYYDDCCYNADGLSEQRTKVAKLQLSLVEEATCERTSFREVPPSPRGAFMVSSCPKSWKGNIDVKNKCEQAPEQDFFDLLPVFDIATNVTFKNRKCALCHDVHNLIPWLVEFKCGVKLKRNYNQSAILSFKDEMELRINSRFCNYGFEPSNDIQARYCYHKLEYLSWEVLKDVNNTACQNRALAPLWIFIETKITIYRNIQCFLDEFGATSLDESVQCLGQQTKTSPDLPHIIKSLIDISTVFQSQGKTLQCSETEIYLSEKIGCKALYCPTNMEPLGGRCNAVTYKTSGITLDLLFETNGALKATDIIQQIIRRLMNETKAVFISDGIDNLSWRNGVNIIPGYNINSKEPCSMVQVNYPLQKNPNNPTTIEHQTLVVKKIISSFQHVYSKGFYIKHVNKVMEPLCKCNVSLRNPSFVIDLFSHDTSLPCPAVKVHLHENYSGDNNTNSTELDRTIDQQHFNLSGETINSADVLSKFSDYFLCVDTFISKYKVVKENHANLIHHLSIVNTMMYVPIICLFYFLV